MYFSDTDIRKIKDIADDKLLEVVQDFKELRRSGASYTCKCPRCGSDTKFTITPGKNLFNCFACHQIKGKGSVAYLMSAEDMSFPDAMEYLAKKFSVILEDKQTPAKPVKKMKKGSKTAKGADVDSYCARMLAESGLTFEDVTANVYKSDDNKSVFQLRTFRPGGIDETGRLTKNADDVIIEYYDLEGLPVTYLRKAGKKDSGERKEYFRVRWQFPDAHLDKNGKSYKYKSPAGSGTPIYIPERLRAMYKAKTEITRLYIQEGEKKAEKACKHGIPSIAVSGIQNLGSKGALPEDLVKIIQTCHVKEVAFIFDSDWDDISQNIKINDQVEQRPRNFFYAAKNYKDYMRALKNRNIYVEIFIGHIQKNELGDKGLDDLLANTLKDKEDELLADIEFACNDKMGLGKYCRLIKISGWTDHKLQELWCLHSAEEFAKRHIEVLRNLPEFLFGR